MPKRFAIGDGVVFPIWAHKDGPDRGYLVETKALGVVIEVLTAGGISYNIRDLATREIHGVIHKFVREPDLLTRLAIASADQPLG